VSTFAACLTQQWPVVILSVAALGLLAFILWLDPINRNRVDPADVAQLKAQATESQEKVEELAKQLNGLRVKLGFVQR
jgi:hypothetical protein